MNEVTRILSASRGPDDASVLDDLLPVVYGELRRLAASKLRQERPDQTLQATALVHEAYLRLLGNGTPPSWENRRHFFGAAAEAMRRILVERARRNGRAKRGEGKKPVALPEDLPAERTRDAFEILALSEALDELGREDETKAELVKLRFFGGLSLADAARALSLSRATAHRHFTFARAWLYDRLTDRG